MIDLAGLTRLAEQCRPDSLVRLQFNAFRDAATDSRRAGGKGKSPAATDACKRILVTEARDLHDIALKSAITLQLFRFLSNSVAMDSLILQFVQEVISIGTAAPAPEATAHNVVKLRG